MRKTCPKSEYLLIDPKIYSFAQSILAVEEITEAEKISELLASSRSNRERAIKQLQIMTGETPKRPLYYLCFQYGFLPHWTRDAVRYLGDYIDQLVKYLASEKLENPKNIAKSLGANIKNLTGILPEPLYSNLGFYNQWIYVPAKHEFNVTKRKHLFTSKEVVFICFITLKLKDEIIKHSQDAKNYSEQKRGYINKWGNECGS